MRVKQNLTKAVKRLVEKQCWKVNATMARNDWNLNNVSLTELEVLSSR